MKYFCTACGYSYDEGLGDKAEGLEGGTKIDLFEYCPNCEGNDTFQGVEEEVNYVKDYDNLDSLEQEHLIIYSVNDNGNINIIVPNHINGDDHRITTITIYDEYKDIVIEKFIGIDDDTELNFDISDLDDFEIRIKCSQHGVWGRKVKV